MSASLPQQQFFCRGPEFPSVGPSVSYVACHLSRRHLFRNHGWGFGFSFGDHDDGSSPRYSLVVGALHPTFHSTLQWAWITSSCPETSILTNPANGSFMWMRYFAMLPRVCHLSPETLLPGDCIVTMNGMPTYSFGNSWSNVIDYLERCDELFLVAVRCNKVTLPGPNWRNEQSHCSTRPSLSLNQFDVPLPSKSNSRYVSESSKVETKGHSSTNTECFKFNKISAKQVHKSTNNQSNAQKCLQLSMHSTKNPIFRISKHDNTNPTVDYVLFSDDGDVWDPDEGKHHKYYLRPIDASQFQRWLRDRKRQWRSKWKVNASSSTINSISSLAAPTGWINPMFPRKDFDDSENGDLQAALPFCDNNAFDPYDGSRHHQFLSVVNSRNFQAWLNHRKLNWRLKRNASPKGNSLTLDVQWAAPVMWTNPMFPAQTTEQGKMEGKPGVDPPLLYYDDVCLFDQTIDETSQFLLPVNALNWSTWLSNRKQKWRSSWTPYAVESEEELMSDQHAMFERLESSIRYDFWTDRYSSFDGWLKSSTDKWKKSYSWNSKKRKRIQQVCEQIVHFPSSHDPLVAEQQIQAWLRVRKNQWRILRRKRQRRWEEETTLKESDAGVVDAAGISVVAKYVLPHPTEKQATGDYVHIDALLEEEERNQKSLAEQKKCRQPLDLSFLFLPGLGLSDDVAAHCVQYLDSSEHGKLLCVSKSFGEGLKSRAYMWQLLCRRCSHWHVPRRPRKPWHKLYFSKLQKDGLDSQKLWDDLLTNISVVLFKGDQLKLVKKLIEGAEKKFSFTIDYVSGVVCERNSILNLSVIHKRHKVVRWLVEEKNADIETSDRGHFTPLINAAWGGDKQLVRFLLHHGADRSKVGTGHYTEALAPSDFEGLTAEGWAQKKGHHDIAKLIRVGL